MITLESLQKQVDELKRQNKLVLAALLEFKNNNQVQPQVETAAGRSSAPPANQPVVVKQQKLGTADHIKKIDASLEENIGTKWFSRIGITALVVGVGFFIKYAIDNDLISYLARIIIGVIIGASLIAVGEFFSGKVKYHKWGKTLVGGGLAIIYFVIYAAYHFIEYRNAIGISQELDIALLSVAALLTIFFSLKDNSQIIAGEAFFLGFATSLIGADFQLLTLIYNFILALVLIVVVLYKQWPLIGIGGLIGTYLTYAIWFFDNSEKFGLALVFLSMYFTAYTVQSLLLRPKKAGENSLEIKNIIITLLNAALFFSFGLYLVRKNFLDYDSLFSFLLALFYFCLGGFFYFDRRFKIASAAFYLGILFLTITIPLYFHKQWITVAWSLLTLILIILWSRYKDKILFYAAHFVCLATMVKIIAYDAFKLPAMDFSNLLNSARFFTFLFAVVCFYLAYIILNKSQDELKEDEKDIAPFVYSLSASLLLAMIILLEFSCRLCNYSHWITISWSIISLALIYLSLNTRFTELKYQGVALSFIVAAKIVFFDVALNEFNWVDFLESYRVFSFLAGLALFYWATFYLNAIRQKLKGEDLSLIKIYSWLATFLFSLLILLEIKDYWISIDWAILGLLILSIGFYQRRWELRYQGIILLGVTILKVFLYDTKELSTIYRTISFMALGSILLATSFIYIKYKDKLKEIL